MNQTKKPLAKLDKLIKLEVLNDERLRFRTGSPAPTFVRAGTARGDRYMDSRLESRASPNLKTKKIKHAWPVGPLARWPVENLVGRRRNCARPGSLLLATARDYVVCAGCEHVTPTNPVAK